MDYPPQQEYIDQSMPMQQPPLISGHTTEGALQYQLESIEIVERVERIIKGEVEAPNPMGSGTIWKPAWKPMVNEKGLNVIRGYLSMYLGGTKTFALSDLNDEYISSEVIDVGRNIKNELMDHWVVYDVKDYSSASFIINIVTAAVHAVLRKGGDATYLKFLRTTQNIQEVQHHQAFTQQMQRQQPDKSIIGTIFGRRKK
jgi:hypothetical protein